jgi:hypothetical protein
VRLIRNVVQVTLEHIILGLELSQSTSQSANRGFFASFAANVRFRFTLAAPAPASVCFSVTAAMAASYS